MHLLYSYREATLVTVGLDTIMLEENAGLVLTTFMGMTWMEMEFVMIVTTVQKKKTLINVMRMLMAWGMCVMMTMMEMVD